MEYGSLTWLRCKGIGLLGMVIKMSNHSELNLSYPLARATLVVVTLVPESARPHHIKLTAIQSWIHVLMGHSALVADFHVAV